MASTTFRRLWLRAALLACGASFAIGAPAQTPEFGSCVRIEDLSARLACYDRAAGRAPSASPAAPAAVAPAPAMPRDPVAAFGAPGKSADDLTAAKVQTKTEDQAPGQIEARVTAIRVRPEGQQVLTLENGQVWTQNEVQREPRFAVGDLVVIKRGLLGSFLLNLQKGSQTTRVSRIS